MTVGIPRAMQYYYYEDLWQSFFKNLGIETILSPPTNKEIIDRGVYNSIDEACFSSKIFIGHVEYLLDKCDMVFLPRIETTAIREEYCTRIFGLYDIVRNTYPDAKLLHANVSYLLFQKEKQAFLDIGQALDKSEEESLKAYKDAVSTANKIKEEKILKQEELLNGEGLKVLIISHAYNTFDASIGKVVTDYFTHNKVKIAYADLVDEKKAQAITKEKYGSRIYWKVTAEMLGGFEMYKGRVDGIVLISSFPCGPDSIFNELLIRTIKDKPILSLIFDEHDASAGIQTRLESFVDILMAERRIVDNGSFH